MKLNAMLARPILALARSMPMLRMNGPMRCFWVAKTCSTAERTLDRAALARWRWGGGGLPGDRRKWIFDTSPARRIARSFFWLR